MTKRDDPVKTVEQFADAIAILVESGLYDETTLGSLVKPLGEAQLAAGGFTPEMGERLDALRVEIDDPNTTQSWRRDVLIELLEVLADRKFIKRRECLSDFGNVLGPNNAKLWREFQRDRRELDARIAAGGVATERAAAARASARAVEFEFETKAKKAKQLSELEAQLKTDRESGRISPQRAARLDTLFPEIRAHLDTPLDADDATVAAADMRLRELLDIVLRTMSEPSGGDAFPTESRAARLSRHLVELKESAVAAITSPRLREGERALLDRAGTVVVQSASTLESHSSDAEAVALEREVVRETALELNDYQVREHLMLIEPVWPTPRSQRRDPNAVTFAGTGAERAALNVACNKRGLALGPASKRGTDPAVFRWEELWSAHVAAFDLSAQPGSIELAASCYELGIALALGRPVVVFASADRAPPFDLDLAPVILRGDDSDAELIGDALDQAMYAPQRRGLASSVRATVQFARKRLAEVREEADTDDPDPLVSRRLLGDAIGRSSAPRQLLCLPPWPAEYPDPAAPRAFHVMPFRATLDWTVSVVSNACKSAKIAYIRGDRVFEPNIVASIWEEICRATHVVADITTLNANVFLELGMAHTVGRSVLVIGQDPAAIAAIPTLAKTRVFGYSKESLGNVLDRFFRPE